MEDLGSGISLADRLLGDDGSAAVAALEAYVRTLARMHRETRGDWSAWNAARRTLGGLGALPIGVTDSQSWHRDPNDEDRAWGIATLRQRNRLRVDNFLMLSATELLPALTETLGRLRDRLPAAEAMPFYPALRG
jgi:hypothetical protein